MDIISHGLWGAIAFGKENRRKFWNSFIFGIMPDFLAFAPFFIARILGTGSKEWEFGEPPDPSIIPAHIYQVYDFTHSLIVFSIMFLILWVIFKRPVWEFSA